MKQIAKRKPVDGAKHVERVRRICLGLPETWEKISHGEPTWCVKKKVFAMFSNNHHNDGHSAVTIPAAIGIQAMLVERAPEKFTDHLMLAYAAGSASSSIKSRMKSWRSICAKPGD